MERGTNRVTRVAEPGTLEACLAGIREINLLP
jgi:hypothetical protein